MNLEQIKELLYSDQYSFLHENEHLGNNIILLTLCGSHGYGISNENSDLDVRGIFGERKQEILGLSKFEQFEDKETDTVIYSFKKIVELLINCNPNTVELLGTKPEHIFMMTEEGKLLRDNAHLFLSKRAGKSFSGYAKDQLQRLENALARDSYPQTEKENHILKTLLGIIPHLQEKYRKWTNGSLNLYIDKSDKEDIESEIFMDIDLKHYPLRDFKNIYSEMSNITTQYGKLNKRNNKKDEIHLLKHSVHLVRLYLMGIEILEGKGINTYREKDRDFLLKIRNGEFTYPEIFEMTHQYEKDLKYAIDNSPLPENPDMNKIEELVMEINSKLLKKYKQ